MSVEALSLVFKADIESSPDKFVLVALANHASAAGYCWPSQTTIARLTSLNEKTVKAAIKRLLEAGYIFDTGERRGLTNQVKVYSINLAKLAPQPDLFIEERKQAGNGPLGDFPADGDPANGSVEPLETGPNLEGFQNRKASDFGAKGAQKRPIEPSITKIDISTGAGSRDDAERPEHVRAAIALRITGLAVNSMHPGLVAACAAGVTAQRLVDLAKTYPGKPINYLLPIALQQLAQIELLASEASAQPTGAKKNAPGRESAADRSARLAAEADARERRQHGADDDAETA